MFKNFVMKWGNHLMNSSRKFKVFKPLHQFMDHQNYDYESNVYRIKSHRVPKEFSGYRIIHLSDLHIKQYRNYEEDILHKVRQLHPDLIVITGDVLDSRKTSYSDALKVLRKISMIAKTYYVYGNHEIRLKSDVEAFRKFEERVASYGIQVLDKKCIKIVKGEASINLLGVKDPLKIYQRKEVDNKKKMEERLKKSLNCIFPTVENREGFTILLSHRPEHLAVYAQYPIDLVLSGHAHGGQWRIPWIGGLYAPSQGVLPKFTSGMHKKENTKLIVSRGVGESSFPLRLFNHPEIILVTLETK